MPSRKKTKRQTHRRVQHTAFFPLLVLSFVFWFIYRGVFQFSVLFDELIGKAIFFGLPVWLYILVSGFQQIADTFSPQKIRRGLMTGIAVGGLFGFAASLLAALQKTKFYAVFPFSDELFWREFLMALFTGFWETLFFFSFVMLVAQAVFKRQSFLWQLLFTAGVFLIFHLPNILLRFEGVAVAYQIILLSLFALGQALLFSREKNGYALVLSHTLWGMALLFHF